MSQEVQQIPISEEKDKEQILPYRPQKTANITTLITLISVSWPPNCIIFLSFEIPQLARLHYGCPSKLVEMMKFLD